MPILLDLKFPPIQTNMINLGDRVKDKVTGLTGIATGRSEWLNGCVRFAVQSEKLKDGKPHDAQWVDEPQLELVKPRAVVIATPEPPKRTGGPRTDAQRSADPSR